MKRLACLLLLAVAVTGCDRPSALVHRPTDAKVDAAVTAMWAHEIHGVARDGDWVLTRSYAAIADAIVLTTSGEDLSHASIYDAGRDSVIEVVDSGVREIPLAALLDRNHYAIVVRPSGMTATDGARAVERARSRIGAAYDVSGIFGIDDPEKFYCSELVYWASQTETRSGRQEHVVTPADLMTYGEVIYWSGKRTEPQVMELATSRPPRAQTQVASTQ